jgi:hypothetical protein
MRSGMTPFLLNVDYSEAIFFDTEGRTFITKNGGDRVLINGPAIFNIVLPENTQHRMIISPTFILEVNGIQTFSNFVASTANGLMFYDENLELTRISDTSGVVHSGMNIAPSMSRDSSVLVYLNQSHQLLSVNLNSPDFDISEPINDVIGFVISYNGQEIYYVTISAELFYYSMRSGESKKVSDYVIAESLNIAPNSSRLFFLRVSDFMSPTAMLYSSDSGSEPTRILGGDNVVNFWKTPANIFFLTRNNMMFRSDGGTNFKPFHEFAH